MVKGHLTLYIDANLIDLVKAKGINCSKLFEEAIAVVLEGETKPPDMEKEELKTREMKLKSELAGLQAKIIALESQTEQKKLIEEKEKGSWIKL